METFRIIHTADLHHGNKPAILNDIIKCEGALLEAAKEIRPHAIVIAGDLYDEGVMLGSAAAITAAHFVKWCADIAPVLVVRGTSTHDADGQVDLLDTIKANWPIYSTDRLEQVFLCHGPTAGVYWQPATDSTTVPKYALALFSCLPSISKAGLMAVRTVDEAGDTNLETTALLRDVLSCWGILNLAANISDLPTVLVGHGTLTGAQFSSGQTALGRDLEFTRDDLYLARCELYCLGHIHKMQLHGDRIYYSGSITRLNYGETEDKGFFIHERSPAAGGIATRFIATPARAMKTKTPAGLPTVEVLDDVKPGDNVRIVYEVAEEDVHLVDEAALRARALELGAADVKIEKTIVQKIRIRSEGISRVTDLGEKLVRWSETTGSAINEGMRSKLDELILIDDPAIIIGRYDHAAD